MSEQAIFFTTDAQMKAVMSKLMKSVLFTEIGVSRVRRPYVDKTRFKKRVEGTHIISFCFQTGVSVPFDDDVLVDMGDNKWGFSTRLETTKKKWMYKGDGLWVCNDGSNAGNMEAMIKHLGITRASEFDTTFEIPAPEFFGGIAVLDKMLRETPVEEWRPKITGWAKTFLSRCIQAEPVFVITNCSGASACECDIFPLVCEDCGCEADKLIVSDAVETPDEVAVEIALMENEDKNAPHNHPPPTL
jgi:hypothetical protein